MIIFRWFNRLCYLLAVGVCAVAMFCYGEDVEYEE